MRGCLRWRLCETIRLWRPVGYPSYLFWACPHCIKLSWLYRPSLCFGVSLGFQKYPLLIDCQEGSRLAARLPATDWGNKNLCYRRCHCRTPYPLVGLLLLPHFWFRQSFTLGRLCHPWDDQAGCMSSKAWSSFRNSCHRRHYYHHHRRWGKCWD